MKKILIASTQYPYYGGASSNAYALIKYFRKKYKVAGLFFEDGCVNVDPDDIGNVWRLGKNSDSEKIKNNIINFLDGEPEYILAKNYVAPVASKILFPKSKIIYLVAGSPQMMELSKNNISAVKYLKDRNVICKFKPEEICINQSDIIIPNSVLAKKLLLKNYSQAKYIKKVIEPIDTSMIINNRINQNKIKSFTDRKIDIAFVCSNFSRKVKNQELALDIFSNFAHLNKIVIGKNNEKFNSIKNTEVLDLTNQSDVINILNNTKLVLCTSYYDASSNVIKEALSCKSNILISKNCGWSEGYPSEFVCADVYNKKEWYQKTDVLTKSKIIFEQKKDISVISDYFNRILV